MPHASASVVGTAGIGSSDHAKWGRSGTGARRPSGTGDAQPLRTFRSWTVLTPVFFYLPPAGAGRVVRSSVVR